MARILHIYCLLAVSMLMLAMAVIPHHHHGSILCMKAEVAACAQEGGHCTDVSHHHAGDRDRQACTVACATHFDFGYQQLMRSDISPQFTYHFLIYPLLPWIANRTDFLLSSDYSDYQYIEQLHGRQRMAAVGFRAPPAIFRLH